MPYELTLDPRPMPSLFILLPPARAHLAQRICATGAIPVIDHPLPAQKVPEGCGVRVSHTDNAPGNGPVFAAEGNALPGRPCWRETQQITTIPEGYQGLYLRGRDSGGLSGDIDVRETAGIALLDWPHPPSTPIPPGSSIVLSDPLFALLEPPPTLLNRLHRLNPADLQRIGNWRIANSLASPALRRLLNGEDFYRLTDNLWENGDAFETLWPGGTGLYHAQSIQNQYKTLENAIAAWTPKLSDTAPTTPPPAFSTVQPSTVQQSTYQPSENQSPEPIAIIGLGCRLPGALNIPALWNGLLNGFNAIKEVEKNHWDWRLFYDPNPDAPDRTYAKIGAFVDNFKFDPKRYRIPPNVARSIDLVQQWALESAYDALQDAGYGPDRNFDRERTAVILGNSMGGEITHSYNLRVMIPALKKVLNDIPDFMNLPVDTRIAVLDAYEATIKANTEIITEDSMPGELSNVVAGRIANALNLGGPNFTTDAACASSLAALETAVKGLLDHEYDLVLTGGSDRTMNVATYVKFCKIGALSPDGSRPFDANANGFVMGEGAGILLLKRLSDAIKDGDKIYALIRGIGASSDGKGKGITAPNPDGQIRALNRAYTRTNIDPRDVDLWECHGTSTVVGDKVEVESLTRLIGKRPTPARIGSIKSNIGHLKSAAGAAALLKTTLALHHGILPPSINYRTPRSDLPLETVPLQVQTQPEAWQGHRIAGASAFGFGGTNFHVVLEQYTPGQHTPKRPPATEIFAVAPAQTPAPAPAPAPAEIPRSIQAPLGIIAISADSTDALIKKIADQQAGKAAPYEPDSPLRLTFTSISPEEDAATVEKVLTALKKDKGYDLLRQRGISMEDEPCNGKLALLFTGQGSQYIDMGLDLAAVYPVVAQTFAEADAVMAPELGRPLTDFIRRDPSLSEDVQFQRLMATEISQPATLTVDVALLRLLKAYGITPDMVAGHSLGEYGAAVAAGILSFSDALLAVSARGREMASVKLDDPGKMAGIATSEQNVAEVLTQIPGYVIAANKNCPTQTVIAGESKAVEAASEVFRSRGITVIPLPVSHAFHSRIVSPASEPLKRVLQRLGVNPPTLPITTNVTGDYYPHDRDAIIDILARQVAAPVEWMAQIERMYADGARIFIECGPKRALSGFVVGTLRKQPHRALSTNHPKRGGIPSFRDALAALLALGFPVRSHPDRQEGEVSGPRRATTQAMADRKARLTPVATPEPVPAPVAAPVVATPTDWIASLLPANSTIDPTRLATALEGPLRTFLGAAVAALAQAAPPAPVPVPAPVLLPTAPQRLKIVCSGASVGLPGGKEVFAADNFESILRGENRIRNLTTEEVSHFLNKHLVRLEKNPQTGEGTLTLVENADQVIRLAGAKAHFDLADYGIDPEQSRALDITTQLAFAAGLEALKDAGIPLVRRWHTTTTGKQVPVGWCLPPQMQDDTGIIFASAFAGYDQLIKKLKNNGDDGHGSFDRRFLFQILAMGHSQLAQLIGARGPNTAINAACASTSQAVTIAEDWIRTGRAQRVLIVAADDVTGDSLLEWIGAGFLAAGAAATDDKVENAALPFDRRRHGLLLGMGAVGLLIETEAGAYARGMEPIAELLASRASNSAFHGTRLDAAHIASEFARFAADAVAAADVTPAQFAERAVFMSHETFTPARGGSAAAEMAAIPAAFGTAASRMIIANTKGFTGHAMGAGMEDAVVLKILQSQTVPPIPNLKEPDPDLGPLRLSQGGHADVDYAIRLSAGFGSQLVLLAWKRRALHDARIRDAAAHRQWLSTLGNGKLVVEHRQLRWIDVPQERPATPAVVAAPVVVAPVAAPVVAAPVAAPIAQVVDTPMVPALDLLIGVISEKTGYDISEIDPAYELEADLGIDTVKQAEIFGIVREHLSMPRDDSFKLSDHPTVEKLAAWLEKNRQDQTAIVMTVPSSPVAAPVAAPVVETPRESTLSLLSKVISEKTGYDLDEIDPAYELEADLGIDTVKQAEIFGIVRERLSMPRDDSFKLSDHPTVEKLAAWLDAHRQDRPAPVAPPVIAAPVVVAPVVVAPVIAPVVVAPVVPVVAAPVVAAAPASAESTLSLLISVISEKTGYDIDEIDPAYELEADLGIDTVKQAEIFGIVRERLSLPRDDSFKLSDYPTVEKLARWLERSRKPHPSLSAPTEAPKAEEPKVETPKVEEPKVETPKVEETKVEVTKVEVTKVEETKVEEPKVETPKAETPKIEAPKAPAGIPAAMLDDFDLDFEDLDIPTPLPVFTDLPEPAQLRIESPALKALKAAPPPTPNPPTWEGSPTVLPAPPVAVPVAAKIQPPPTLIPLDMAPTALSDSFRLRRMVRIQRILSRNMGPLPPIRVLGETPLAETLRRQIQTHPDGMDPSRSMVVIDAGAPFIECFHVAKGLHDRAPTWICAIEDDGSGSMRSARDTGARAGLAKALGREWNSHAQVIHLDPWLSVNEAAEQILTEAQQGEKALHVWLGPANREVGVLETVERPRPTAFNQKPVVLLTGGTRGITATVAIQLARRGPCTLILVARTAPGETPLNESIAREQYRKQLEAAGQKATPRQLEDHLKPLRAAEEARRTVSTLRRLGAEVEVKTVDMSVERAVYGLLADVLDRHGHIDIAIHGAGLEESRKLSEKTEADVQRVFGAKAEGGLWLAEGLPSGTFFVSMGSVAGFFGNPGQVDYAAANAAMAAVCIQRPWSLHIAWTAWADTGMAVRGGMGSLLHSRGIELIPAEAGADLLVDLIQGGIQGELLAAGKLGDFRMPSWHPLLDTLDLEGDIAIGRRTMDLNKDRWLEDHVIDGFPVLPGVIGLELMAATALGVYPRGRYAGAEDVRFVAPLKLYHEEPADITVTAEHIGDGAVVCVLRSRRTTRAGKQIETEHFRAKIHLEDAPLLPTLPAGYLPDEDISQDAIYQRFFHGPRFRVLRAVEAMSVQGLVVRATVDHAAIALGLLSDPLVLEAAFQAAGLHRLILDGILSLPASIDALNLFREVVDDEPLTLTVYRRDDAYDIDVDDAEGAMMQIRGFRLSDKGPLPPNQRFPVPEGGWASVATATATEAEELSEADRVAMTQRGSARRQADRLAGQLAGRRAAAPIAGGALRRDPLGAPFVEGSTAGVSISHQQGEALAIAMEGARVGVDIESVEPRDPAFLSTWFSPEERVLLHDDASVASAWAIKEAVLKALGMGMRLPPQQIQILSLQPPRVELQGEVDARHRLMGGTTLRIRRGWWKKRVLAFASLRVAI